MTDKECKYKFSQPHFKNGAICCALLEDKCEDIKFICDKNCSVFEMQQQLCTATEQLSIAREALEDITIGEQHNAEYSKCDEWIEPWFGDICPCIDCGVCIAKQALAKIEEVKC